MRRLVLCAVMSAVCVSSVYAADLVGVQQAILERDYPKAIENARSGAQVAQGTARAEWLYYCAEGLLLNRDFLDAIQIFRSVIMQYPSSDYAPRSVIRSGDAYYMLERYQKAYDIYTHFLTKYPGSKYAPQVYLKAAYAAQKLGKTSDVRKFSDILRTTYPQAIEKPFALSSVSSASVSSDFKAQAGVFANKRNAEILASKLVNSNFVPTVVHGSDNLYHVYCGSYADPDLADRLVRELKMKGYSAKRVP